MSSSTGPNLSESKSDGEVYFLVDDPPRPAIGPYKALIHLFEHAYDPVTTFWYGVADVACTVSEYQKAASAAGVAEPHPGFGLNPMNSRLRIELADGRWGSAHPWTSHSQESLSDQHHRIAFVCETALEMKPGRHPGT